MILEFMPNALTEDVRETCHQEITFNINFNMTDVVFDY